MRMSLALDLAETSAANNRTHAQLGYSLCRRPRPIFRFLPVVRSAPAITLAALLACLPRPHYARQFAP